MRVLGKSLRQSYACGIHRMPYKLMKLGVCEHSSSAPMSVWECINHVRVARDRRHQFRLETNNGIISDSVPAAAVLTESMLFWIFHHRPSRA